MLFKLEYKSSDVFGKAMEVDSELVQVKTGYEALDETRRSMEEIMEKIISIKKEGKPKSQLRDLNTEMSLLFITLRQLNRTILVEEDRIKAETESAKAPVDFTTLQLHNLMYEKDHYLKAINTCRDFRSKYPDIELVPEEEYFKNALDDLKFKVLASDASHDLMLKRLNFELFQRKELCKLHEKLEQHKRSLVETIGSRKKFLSSLPSHLKSLKKATLPVQQQLGITHTKKMKQNRAAELLPLPLYIVYSQFLAQKEAFGEKIDLEISGSVKDAHTFCRTQASKKNGISTNMESNRLEEDAPDDEDDVQKRRKRPKKNPPKEIADQEGIWQSHPLKLIVRVFDDGDSSAKPRKLMSLMFEYFVKLNVVCVGVEDAEQGSDENILCNLFPDDTGTEFPHQTAKLYAGNFTLASGKRCSRPYIWAQHLAGFDFLPEFPIQLSRESQNDKEMFASTSSGLSLYRRENRVHTVLQRIRSRKKSQLALVEQLNYLAKLKWPLMDTEKVPWASHCPLCSLFRWTPLGPATDSSLTAVSSEKVISLTNQELNRRSTTPCEVESAREDGELPMALPATAFLDDTRKRTSNRPPNLDISMNSTSISKNITPPKLARSLNIGSQMDDSDIILDADSDVEEITWIEPESEVVSIVKEPWENYAAREFHLVLRRKDGNEQTAKLEAMVKITVEYPLRAPLFTLRFLSDGHQDSSEYYYNELRAIESEVNLHILDILPSGSENYILAHQMRCLAVLFDRHFESQFQQKTSSSAIDAGLSLPVNDVLLDRAVRGRDRRRMLAWKGMECNNDHLC